MDEKNELKNLFVPSSTNFKSISAGIDNDYMINTIIGWKIKEGSDIQYIPKEIPDNHHLVVGSFAEEWEIKKCDNKHIYVIPEDLLIGPIGGSCYGEPLVAYKRDKRILQWLTGFAPIKDSQPLEFGPFFEIENDSKHDLKIKYQEDLIEQPAIEGFEPGEVQPYASVYNAYDLYVNRCDCGDHYDNNCAHYLSNALIKAGFRFSKFKGAKCKCGRPIRAKELLKWVQIKRRRFRPNHSRINSGYWIVYQESKTGQGHVCFHKESGDSHISKGTGNYLNWPVQWHYLI